MTSFKLTPIGHAVGGELPKEMLVRLKLREAETVFVTKAADGLTPSPFSPELNAQMMAARAVMRQRRNVLRELAK